MSESAVRRLHAVRQARAVPHRHIGPRRGALHRRRSRFRLRGPRPLRPLPGGGRHRPLRQVRDRERARPSEPGGREGSPLRFPPRLGGRPPAGLLGTDPGRCRHRRAAREPGPQAGRAQARRGQGLHHRSRDPAALCRGRGARHAQSAQRLRAPHRRARRAVGPGRPHRRPARPARPAARAPGRRMVGDGGGPPGDAHRRRLARLPRAGLWRGLRHRLHHHRLPSGRDIERRRRGLRRAHEPADPLRRGPDEPGLLRHDEPWRRGRADRGRARRGERPDRRGCGRSGRRAQRHSQRGLRRQPDHAPPAARHRPDRAGRRALRARGLGRAHAAGARHRPRRQSGRARLRPALHRGPRRRRCGGRGALRSPAPGRRDGAHRRCRHQCRDRARQPRAAAGRVLAHRPRLRRRADHRRPARGTRARSSGCASTATRWRPGSRSSAAIYGRTRRASPRPPPPPASPASAARASSRRWPRCTSRASCSRTAPSPGPHAPGPSASSRRGGPSATCSTPASRRSRSTRTTCAPFSWPRRRSWPAHGC